MEPPVFYAIRKPKQLVFVSLVRLITLFSLFWTSDRTCVLQKKLFKIAQNSNKNTCAIVSFLKLVSAIFCQTFIFHQMIALRKLWKMFFISSKKIFSFSRYSNFCIFVFSSFFPVSHCFRGWFKKNLKVYDVINCLNKNWITHV